MSPSTFSCTDFILMEFGQIQAFGAFDRSVAAAPCPDRGRGFGMQAGTEGAFFERWSLSVEKATYYCQQSDDKL